MTQPYRPFDGDAWLLRELPLAGDTYRIVPEAEFEVAGEMAFARQGRKSRVYKLVDAAGSPFALKVFYRGFSLAEQVTITRALRPYGAIAGLRVCGRSVIEEEEALALGEPGLTYAILMPWIEGLPWAGVVEHRHPLAGSMCLDLAAQTAQVLARLEATGLTHADISSSNVLITTTADGGQAIELIDVEDMYHERFSPLPHVPDGTAGYAHPRNHGRGCRNRYGDRFAGAILLTEMVAWSDPAVRTSTEDTSLFSPTELCRGGPKYELVRKVLQAHSSVLADLFVRVWDSSGLAGCPPLRAWADAMATVHPSTHETAAADLDSVERSTAPCPGCGRLSLHSGSADVHAPGCPLRPPPGPGPSSSTFPGVPTYDDVHFVPLFDEDSAATSGSAGVRRTPSSG